MVKTEKVKTKKGKAIKKSSLKARTSRVKVVKVKTAAKKAPAHKESSLTLPVYDMDGHKKKTVKLDPKIFSAPVGKELLAQYVHVYLTNQRQGTASAKTRAEVKGSTRKIYRQKGTGRARHGARSAPIFVGGGVVGGPRPKNYSLKLNKKQKKRALFGALSFQYKEGNTIGVDETGVTAPKTKTFASFLKKLDISGKKILFILPKMEKSNLVLSSRNIPRLQLADAKSINAYEVLNTDKLLLTSSALEVISAHFLTHEKH